MTRPRPSLTPLIQTSVAEWIEEGYGALLLDLLLRHEVLVVSGPLTFMLPRPVDQEPTSASSGADQATDSTGEAR